MLVIWLNKIMPCKDGPARKGRERKSGGHMRKFSLTELVGLKEKTFGSWSQGANLTALTTCFITLSKMFS